MYIHLSKQLNNPLETSPEYVWAGVYGKRIIL